MLKIQDAYLTYLAAAQQLINNTILQSETLEPLAQDIRHTEFLVPVIGEYSAGKSSLLNAFLGGEVLPVGLKPVTELATELRYGSDPHLLALLPDGSSERLDTGAIATIKLRAHEFTHLQLYLDHPRLQAQPSLVLVDMPGFGSSLASHEKALAYYLPRGVHFIIVVSAEAGNLTQSLMRRLDDIHTYGRGFSFVLNKTNLLADEEVDAVAGLIETQIQTSFAGIHPLIRAGRDAGERLAVLLGRLDSEQIARGLFEERLKDATHTLLNQLNAAMSAARKASAGNEAVLLAMAQGIEQIERKRDGLLDELASQEAGRTAAMCVAEVGRELDFVRDELVAAGLAGDRGAFGRIVAEVIRTTTGRVIKAQMDAFSHQVVADFASALSSLQTHDGGLDDDPGWLNELSEKIDRSLRKTGDALGHWSGSLAEHNTRELERLKQEQKWKEGDPLPEVNYQRLATVLAVMTSVVNPLIELAIIFLPGILASLQQSRQREQLRQKIAHETIPAIQRQLRSELPPLLAEQLDALVSQIGQQFEQEINVKKQVLDELASSRSEGEDARKQQLAALAAAREELQRLAKHTLYSEN
jgi:GTP-binding protein EngB required for normal cell division